MKINNTNFYTHNHIELARPNNEDSLENLVGKKGFKEFMILISN